MACPFCATGQGGLTRNLSTAEISDQVVRAGEKVTNVVFIGMGVTQRAVFTMHYASGLTCSFTVVGAVLGLRVGVVGRAMQRRSGACLVQNVGVLAGVGCCGGGRARRGRSMTRRVR
jgi:hypothetical protein